MVFQFQFRDRSRFQNLIALLPVSAVVVAALFAPSARAAESAAAGELRDAQSLFRSGQYFKAARYAFNATGDKDGLSGEAYSWVTLGLLRSRLYHSATYFFIKTLESGDKVAIRRVLSQVDELQGQVGPDILRRYLIRHTRYEDYDSQSRSAYLFSLAKTALLSGHEEKAIGYVNGISEGSPIFAYALQLRGSAHAILGKNESALRDFQFCQSRAGKLKSKGRDRLAREEAEDLQGRCLAGEARTLYQMERFEAADQVYDRISKASYVWPDILFEQAWNAFAQEEFNRTLGRLVSYKSPALSFVYNPEVDVLRAQAYLALCLYKDANDVVNDFNTRYASLGEQIKRAVEGAGAGSAGLESFYELGRQAVRGSLYSEKVIHRVINRFARGPYFQNLVRGADAIAIEKIAIQRFDSMQPGVRHDQKTGFPGFLNQILDWKGAAARRVGGAFIKNSLMDYHASLLADFDKISFIKLEMLKRAKESLLYKNRPVAEGRSWGNVEPSRKDYQYRWSFNGEFWNDELGDYVFGLESECNRSQDG